MSWITPYMILTCVLFGLTPKLLLTNVCQSYPGFKSLRRKLLTLDVAHLAACLARAVTDKAKYDVIVAQKGSNAQALINLLQAVCVEYNYHS